MAVAVYNEPLYLKDLWSKCDRMQDNGTEDDLVPLTFVLDKDKFDITLDAKRLQVFFSRLLIY